MRAPHIGNRVIQIVEVLSNDNALAIASEIKTDGLSWGIRTERTGYEDPGIGVVESGCRHTYARQGEGPGRAAGACRRVAEIDVGVTLSETSGNPVKAQYRLIDHMVVEGIRVRQGKITSPVWNGLGKTIQGGRRHAELIIRKRRHLVAIHKKEFAGEVALLSVVIVEIGDELIVGVVAGRAERACPGDSVLCRGNEERPAGQLCIQGS